MTERDPDSSRISVLLVTYNQEDYVGEALDSLLAQDVDGVIEVIVADDASQDGTLEVVGSYRGKDPRFRFTVLDHSRNRGITRNYQRGFEACTTEYVAILEGDDYWTSAAKLRSQRAFLDEHAECGMCGVNYLVYQEPLDQFTPRTTPGDGYRLLSATDQIADNLASNFSTCMYRSSALRSLPPAIFEVTSYDWIVNICVARHGPIGFLEEPMSVYRLHPGGVWTQVSYVEQLRAQLDVIPAYDDLTDHAYHAEFGALAERLRATIAAADETGDGEPARPAGRGSLSSALRRLARRVADGGDRP